MMLDFEFRDIFRWIGATEEIPDVPAAVLDFVRHPSGLRPGTWAAVLLAAGEFAWPGSAEMSILLSYSAIAMSPLYLAALHRRIRDNLAAGIEPQEAEAQAVRVTVKELLLLGMRPTTRSGLARLPSGRPSDETGPAAGDAPKPPGPRPPTNN